MEDEVKENPSSESFDEEGVKLATAKDLREAIKSVPGLGTKLFWLLRRRQFTELASVTMSHGISMPNIQDSSQGPRHGHYITRTQSSVSSSPALSGKPSPPLVEVDSSKPLPTSSTLKKRKSISHAATKLQLPSKSISTLPGLGKVAPKTSSMPTLGIKLSPEPRVSLARPSYLQPTLAPVCTTSGSSVSTPSLSDASASPCNPPNAKVSTSPSRKPSISRTPL